MNKTRTTRDECEALVVRALRRQPLTVSELMHATGCNRDAVLGVIQGPKFERAGVRQTSKGMRPIVYRLATPPAEPLPSPLDRPLNPIVFQQVMSQLDMARMIRRLASNGDTETARALVKAWQREDGELKRLCER